MVIYIDVLISLNIFVDYLLLKAAGAVLRQPIKFPRLMAASLAGGITSLYILAPTLPVLIDLLVRLIFSALLILIAWGFGRLFLFVKRLAVFFGVNLLYAGAMLGIWLLFKPKGMAVGNGVVYFGISPLLLIVSTLSAYGILWVIRRFWLRDRGEKLCRIRLRCGDREVTLTALADTGHNLTDLLTDAPVVIVDESAAATLMGEGVARELVTTGPPEAMQARYRLIPCRTVGGEGVLPAMRCDGLEVITGGVTIHRAKPVVAVSRELFNGNYRAIISADLME